MIKRRWYAAALLVAACGGNAPAPVRPANTASGSVVSFMRAVADSNLAAMAALWGSAAGPSSQTHQPSDYQKRIVIMQSYLSHDDSRILSDVPDGSEARHAVQVQLRRQACTWTVPFGVIQLADKTWIVSSIDLTAAGNPARPCDPSAQDTSAAK